MATNYKHEDLAELTGAYALDALEADEAEVMDLHLRDCPRCRSEVAGYRETAALLAHTGVDAPTGLWDRLAESLEEAPPAEATIFPMFSARRKPRNRFMVGSIAAAAALVVALNGAVLVSLNNDSNGPDSTQQVNLERVALAAATDPLARIARLRSADGTRTADAVVLPDGRGYLVRHDLPNLAADHTYQLWGIAGGKAKAVSLGVLGSAPRVIAFSASTPFIALAISSERSGGATSPTGTPIVSGELLQRA